MIQPLTKITGFEVKGGATLTCSFKLEMQAVISDPLSGHKKHKKVPAPNAPLLLTLIPMTEVEDASGRCVSVVQEGRRAVEIKDGGAATVTERKLLTTDANGKLDVAGFSLASAWGEGAPPTLDAAVTHARLVVRSPFDLQNSASHTVKVT